MKHEVSLQETCGAAHNDVRSTPRRGATLVRHVVKPLISSGRSDALERIRELQSSLCNIIATTTSASNQKSDGVSLYPSTWLQDDVRASQYGDQTACADTQVRCEGSISDGGGIVADAAMEQSKAGSDVADDAMHREEVIGALQREVVGARRAVATVRAEKAELMQRYDAQQGELREMRELAMHGATCRSKPHDGTAASEHSVGRDADAACHLSYYASPPLVQAASDFVHSIALHLPHLLPASLQLPATPPSASCTHDDSSANSTAANAGDVGVEERQQTLCNALRCITERLIAQSAVCEKWAAPATDEGDGCTALEQLLEVQVVHFNALQDITRKLERVQAMQQAGWRAHQAASSMVHSTDDGNDAHSDTPRAMCADATRDTAVMLKPITSCLSPADAPETALDADEVNMRDLLCDLLHHLRVTLEGTAAGKRALCALEGNVHNCGRASGGDSACMISEMRALLAAMQAVGHADTSCKPASSSCRGDHTADVNGHKTDSHAISAAPLPPTEMAGEGGTPCCTEAIRQPVDAEAAVEHRDTMMVLTSMTSTDAPHVGDTSVAQPADSSTLSVEGQVTMASEGEADEEMTLRTALRHAQQSVKRMSRERAGLRRKLEQRGATVKALEEQLADLQRAHDMLAAQLRSLQSERDSAGATAAHRTTTSSAVECAMTTRPVHAALMLSPSPEKLSRCHDVHEGAVQDVQQQQQMQAEDWTCPLIDFAELERGGSGQLYPAAVPLTNWVRVAQAEPLEVVVQVLLAQDQFTFHAAGPLYHIGLALACDCGLLSGCSRSSSDDGRSGDGGVRAWQRFLLQLQHMADAACASHGDASRGAMLTANCAQFFYALACRAGVLTEDMTVKLSVVLLALCQHVGLSPAQAVTCKGQRARRQWRLLELMARHLHSGDDAGADFFASLMRGTRSEGNVVRSWLCQILDVDYERGATLNEAWLMRCCDALLSSSALRLPALLQLLLCLAQYDALLRPSFDAVNEVGGTWGCLCEVAADGATMDKGSAGCPSEDAGEAMEKVLSALSEAHAVQNVHAATAATALSAAHGSTRLPRQAWLLDELDHKVLPLALLVARALDEPALISTLLRHRTTLYETCTHNGRDNAAQEIVCGEAECGHHTSPARLNELVQHFLQADGEVTAQTADGATQTALSATAHAELVRSHFADLLATLTMGRA